MEFLFSLLFMVADPAEVERRAQNQKIVNYCKEAATEAAADQSFSSKREERMYIDIHTGVCMAANGWSMEK